MATTGDSIENGFGEQLIFRRAAHDTNGEFLELEVVYRPLASSPPAHYHPFQHERFEVLAGEIRAEIGNQDHTYKPGDSFTVPPNVHHRMYNTSTAAGRVLWCIQPALKTETFFETIWGLARDGKTNAKGVPSLLQLAVIGQAYDREFRLVRPPYRLLKLLFAMLAPIGRAIGYRAEYERYSHQPSDADSSPEKYGV